MKELLDSVSEFHRTYRVPMQDAPLTMPSARTIATTTARTMTMAMVAGTTIPAMS